MKNKIVSFFDALFIRHRSLKGIERIEENVRRMKPSEKMVFFILSATFVVTSIVMLIRVSNQFLVQIPTFGGSFIEGSVGNPRFINPVIAISDTDKDLSMLIYSGLLKPDIESGFIPDLAESLNVSEDGLVYDVVLKRGLTFHDGRPLTADDVILTIEKTLDPVIKSPKRTSWEGVAVEKISDHRLRFTLKKPYAHFNEVLTMGILPKHIWQSVTSEEFPFSQFNIDPVGSGPYKVVKISRNSGGIPTSITLEAWRGYALGRPKIKTIVFKFFQNDVGLAKAISDKSVENSVAMSRRFIDTAKMPKMESKEVSLPRVFGVFFNQNLTPVFLNPEVRVALDLSAPRQRIVSEVLGGFGKSINGPMPEDLIEWSDFEADLERAKSLLASAGWKTNERGILEKKTKKDTSTLSFSIATSDTDELKKTAEILKSAWEGLGASVEVKVFEAGDLNQNIIRPRKYDALLFGEIVSKESDLYSFWHSSQRNDPGLNISLYANITADKLLEEMQKGLTEEELQKKKSLFKAEIKKDRPAVFLFTPDFSYVFSPKIKNISLKNISSQNERFVSIKDWYIETDRVWKIFAKNY